LRLPLIAISSHFHEKVFARTNTTYSLWFQCKSVSRLPLIAISKISRRCCAPRRSIF